MLTEDYLMRLINMAIAALLKIAGLKSAGNYLQAMQVFDEMLEQLFGMRSNIIKELNDEAILDLLTYQEVLDIDRLIIAADLFKEEGDIYIGLFKPAESIRSYQRALDFYLVAALSGGAEYLSRPDEKIEKLIKILENRNLPPEIEYSLYIYKERIGQFAAAEYYLSRLLQTPGYSEDMIEEYKDFHKRLLEKSDDELDKGGMLREQVETNLKKFNG
jgi:tetratricopeptide (TPR) repeat protein